MVRNVSSPAREGLPAGAAVAAEVDAAKAAVPTVVVEVVAAESLLASDSKAWRGTAAAWLASSAD